LTPLLIGLAIRNEAVVGQNVKSTERALESLLKAEHAALERIADDNSEANRAAYMEIHKTLETVRSDLHRQHNVVMKVLRFFHLIP
jgi:hypothetical protein